MALPSIGGSPTILLATPEYVAERLREAAETLRALPMPRYARPARGGSAMPTPFLDPWERWNALVPEDWDSLSPAQKIEIDKDRKEFEDKYNEAVVAIVQSRLTEMDEALEWMYWLKYTRNRRVVWAVASGIKYAKISREDGRSGQQIKNVWDGACERIAASLNRGA